MGSANVCAAAVDARCDWVVGISTDKACSAITTYGASKLMMEGIFQQYWNLYGHTRMLLLRYGNVVASNGSVIPLWASQMEQTGRLSITDARMTRFWLSPETAVQMIVQRVSHLHQSGVWVPKVGAMAIRDLALALHPDATLVEVGLRSAEKLHEDLVAPQERSREIGHSAYVIDSAGAVGNSYTSQSAHQLNIRDFRNYLADAQELEDIMRGGR